MTALRKYLIVKATGEARVTKRKPTDLRLDEVAFEVLIHMPNGWGKIHSETLQLKMPDEIPSVDVTRTVSNVEEDPRVKEYSLGDRYMDHAGVTAPGTR